MPVSSLAREVFVSPLIVDLAVAIAMTFAVTFLLQQARLSLGAGGPVLVVLLRLAPIVSA